MDNKTEQVFKLISVDHSDNSLLFILMQPGVKTVKVYQENKVPYSWVQWIVDDLYGESVLKDYTTYTGLSNSQFAPLNKSYILAVDKWDFPVAKSISTNQSTIFGHWGMFNDEEEKCKGCGKALTKTGNEEADEGADLCVNCYYNTHVKPSQYSGPKCECGAKKAGDKYHSRWCAMYIDPMAPKVTSK
jgi:hypothetical protein